MCDKYSDDYKHLDNLIWQVPTWCMAIFTGILIGVNGIITDTSSLWPIGENSLLILIFLSGTIFLFSLSYTLFRFRCHQVNTEGADSPCSFKFGAQFLLQFTTTFQTTVFFGLFFYTITDHFFYTAIVAGLFLLLITLFYERQIKSAKNRKDKSKAIET